MKKALLSVLVMLSLTTLAQKSTNYEITLDGKTYDIDLNKPYELKTKQGLVQVEVKQKRILTYSDDLLSLNYFNNLSISETEIDQGISQLACLSANGSGFMIQKYQGMNPEVLIDIMAQELTKESIEYGYKETREDISKKTKTGEQLKGKKITLKYIDDIQYYEVVAFGKKDKGVLIITILNDDYKDKDSKIIDLLFDSLALKF